MPSFDPPGTVSKFKHIVCRVHLDIQDMGNGRYLIHLGVNDRFQQQQTGDRGIRG
jgi:hypothetical protein